MGICYSACFYSWEEVQTTALLLFTGVSASAELGFLFAIAKAYTVKITGEQEDEMRMCRVM